MAIDLRRARVAIALERLVEHLAQANLVVVGGRSAAVEVSLARRLQRRRALDEIGDRIGGLESQAQAHFDRARDALQLRRRASRDDRSRKRRRSSSDFVMVPNAIGSSRTRALRAASTRCVAAMCLRSARTAATGHSLTIAQSDPDSSR